MGRITTRGLDIVDNDYYNEWGPNPFDHELIYDKDCDTEKTGFTWAFDSTYKKKGAAAEKGAALGLPFKIRGNPLGCGCEEANLHGISEVKDGEVECDYMCDAGWHNWVVLRVKQKKQPKKQEITVDKFGNPMQDEGFKATELEEL